MRSWLVLAIPFLTVGCGDKEGDTATDTISGILALSGDASNGESVYASYCSGCHGTSGEGGTGPAMTEVIPEHSDEEIVDIIYNGVGTSMAGYGGTLSDQEIADLLAHLTSTY